MYIVLAESRITGLLEYVSGPLPNEQANELASELRKHTRLKVSIESPAVRDTEIVINAKGNAN